MGEQPNEWFIKMKEKLENTEEDLQESNQRERLNFFYASDIFNMRRDELEPSKVSMSMWTRSWKREEMEMKEACLVHFLRRSEIRNPLESYLDALNQMSNELKDAYEGLGYVWEFDGDHDQHFLQMMLLNGAFLVEFMRTKREYYERRSLLHSPAASASDNPVIWRILEDNEETKRYQRDILLMGNQLPLMLLKWLLMVEHIETKNYDVGYWRQCLTGFAEIFVPKEGVPQTESMYNEFNSSLHILDLYRRCLVHRDFKVVETKRRISHEEEFLGMNNIPSATALHSVGIRFTISRSLSMLDVRLRGKTLMLPEIVIDSSTSSLFFNLITFEKHHKDIAKNEVASYLYFMRCLVLVADDAILLQSCGIIITTLPPADVTELFNKMIKDISLDRDNPLAPEITDAFTMVRARYKKMTAEWRKDLFQTYLKSPWAIMSVIAAILLFTLSFVQTVYTVLSYVHPK